MKEHWEHFSHEADIGVRGIAQTKAGAFEQAALALTAVMTELAGLSSQHCLSLHCEAPDDELLFVDWLNAIIYEMAIRKMLFSHFEVKLQDLQLDARICGEAVDVVKHQPVVEIKGATYTELKVTKTENDQWLAQCVVDV